MIEGNTNGKADMKAVHDEDKEPMENDKEPKEKDKSKVKGSQSKGEKTKAVKKNSGKSKATSQTENKELLHEERRLTVALLKQRMAMEAKLQKAQYNLVVMKGALLQQQLKSANIPLPTLYNLNNEDMN